MKSPILKLLVSALAGLPLMAAEPPSPAPPTQKPQPEPAPDGKLSPELAALLRFKPRNQRDVPKAESRVVAATRGGGAPPVKIVALAPTAGGITTLEQPRLWWWQSANTAAGEVEFVLTRMDARPRSVLAIKLGAMKAGYNALDLSNPAINPEKIHLEPKVEYQWTLGCFSQLQKNSVFVRMSRVDDPALAKLLASEPFSSATLTSLSESGNWYELFDTVAFPSRMTPENPEFSAVRAQLLNEVGLQNQTTPQPHP
ncbi:MAG: DUF928 domain-containing protein [Luteolibacter sp.]